VGSGPSGIRDTYCSTLLLMPAMAQHASVPT
jgi:hypothetical protein